MRVDTGTGQVTADFPAIPDLGFTNLTIAFNSGNRAMFVNPNTCTAKTFNGGDHAEQRRCATQRRARHTRRPAARPAFNPTFTASLSSPAPGAHPNLTLGVTSPDKDVQLRNFNLHLPTGLVAATTAAPQCTQANAAIGACVAGNAVGTVTAAIGNGGENLALPGSIYNVVPNASEPARLQAVIPVIVGPYDLGKLSIPVPTTLRNDLGVDTTTQLPTRYEGIAVRVRALQMVLNGTVGGNKLHHQPEQVRRRRTSAPT